MKGAQHAESWKPLQQAGYNSRHCKSRRNSQGSHTARHKRQKPWKGYLTLAPGIIALAGIVTVTALVPAGPPAPRTAHQTALTASVAHARLQEARHGASGSAAMRASRATAPPRTATRAETRRAAISRAQLDSVTALPRRLRAYRWAKANMWHCPYRYGGNGPCHQGGYDCSGFVQRAYRAIGVWLPRVANDIAHSSRVYRVYRPLKGDIAAWGWPYVTHVELVAYLTRYIYGERDPGTVSEVTRTFGSPVFFRVRHQYS